MKLTALGRPQLLVGIGFITQKCPCNIQQFFMAVKNENFQMKHCDNFLIFAQNIDCGYMLEPPHLVGSDEYPQSIF